MVKAMVTFLALPAFFLSQILLLPFGCSLWFLPSEVRLLPSFIGLKASSPEFLLLNQFQGESSADDLQRRLWCSLACPAKRCQFSLLVNPGGLCKKGPAAVSLQSLSCPRLHPLSAALSFFCWPQSLCYDYGMDLGGQLTLLWPFPYSRYHHQVSNTIHSLLTTNCFLNFSITLNLLAFRDSINGTESLILRAGNVLES